MSVGYVYDESMTLHKNELESDHPECPDRIKVIYEELQKQGLIDRMVEIPSRQATQEELQLAHTETYVTALKKAFSNYSEDQLIELFSESNGFDSIFVNQHTFDAAATAAGCTVELVKAILDDTIDSGIAIVRPPGHHAYENTPSGFCFFNNVAVATMVANKTLGKKVAVVDWDVHYGDGTASILADVAGVEFFSIHRFDDGGFYPYNGHPSESNNIHNYGFNMTGDDENYLTLFLEHIIPALYTFQPDIIIVSSGFDAAKGDPLGDFEISPNGFKSMLNMMQAITNKVALVLEGGYNLKVIPKCAVACVEGLLENN